MFKVYFTNHGYFSSETFNTIDAALDYARKVFFDATIWRNDEIIGSWTIFGGYRAF